MSLNPREIPNNFRMQPLIEQGLTEAKALLELASEDTLSSNELINLALIYMESGNRAETKKYASLASAAEAKSTTPSNENKATILYVLATFKREDNLCDEALNDFLQAQELAESDWLKSNLLRNIGLAYLKQQRFSDAYQCFLASYDVALKSPDTALKGSLPALANYFSLAASKDALASGKDMTACITLFDETSALFDTIFTEKGISDEIIRRRSNDYISHCVHRGMILCEISEKHTSEDHHDDLLTAEKILIEALISRKENKADGQRLGDVCAWLGRVYEKLNKAEEAKRSYDEALFHYRTVFSSEETKQISDVKKRLATLTFAVSIAALTATSSFKPSSDSRAESETVDNLTAASTTVVSLGMNSNNI